MILADKPSKPEEIDPPIPVRLVSPDTAGWVERLMDQRIRDLKEYLRDIFNFKIEAAERAGVLALTSAKDAAAKWEESVKDRLASHNNLTQAMKDQAATFISRETFTSEINALKKDIAANNASVQSMRDFKAGHSDTWKIIAAVIGTLTATVGLGLGAYAAFHK